MMTGVTPLLGDAGRRAPSGDGRPLRPARPPAPSVAGVEAAPRLVAALPAAAKALLRARLPRVQLVPLEEHRSNEPAIACLVDPAFLEDAYPGGRWTASIPQGLPLVVWADISPRGAQAVLASAALHPVRILIEGVDDVPAALPALLSAMPRLAHVHRLEEALRPRLERVPAPIRTACARVIEGPESFFDATDLARAAQLSRRHLDRVLANCGFAPGKAIVVGARVWRAHHEIVGEGRSVPDAAQALGYADAKALLRHIRAVTGDGAAAFRTLAAEGCMERVVRHIQPVVTQRTS